MTTTAGQFLPYPSKVLRSGKTLGRLALRRWGYEPSRSRLAWTLPAVHGGHHTQGRAVAR